MGDLQSGLRVLILAASPSRTAGTVSDHLDGFRRYSAHRVTVAQNYRALLTPYAGRHLSALPGSWPLDDFDVLVIHYSNYVGYAPSFDEEAKRRIAAFRGLKAMFVQDEYRTVNLTIENIRKLGVDILFTCVPDSEIEKVYATDSLPWVSKVGTLTGFVPDRLTRLVVPPIAERPIDVGYRARQVPLWLGELGVEKWRIVPAFMARVSGAGLRCDLSYREEDRLYGGEWIRFLTSCRTVLGTESGASVFDFTGEIQRSVESYLVARPDATFEEVQAKFLLPHEGRIRLNQISPRCFEAAAVRTAMVLYEGEYSGILKPGRHYIPLRKDMSNIEEVVDQISDPVVLQQIADCAHEEIALDEANSYRNFVAQFDRIISEEFKVRAKTRGARRRNATIGLRLAIMPYEILNTALSWAVRVLPSPVRRAMKGIFVSFAEKFRALSEILK